MSKSFDQKRKEWADQTTNEIGELLQKHYEVPDREVINVESQQSGRYDKNELTDSILLDYAGVDWLVDTGKAIHMIGERVTRWDNVAIRTDNGTTKPCEFEYIPKAIEQNGVYPTRFVFCRRNKNSIKGAWLLDVEKLFDVVVGGGVRPCKRIKNNDGTAGIAYKLCDLIQNDVVIDSLL